jgi:hypothetical protein
MIRLFLLAACTAMTLSLALGGGASQTHAQDDPDAVVQQFFDEMEAGDLEGALALVTDDIVLTDIGRDSFAAYGKPAFGAAVSGAIDLNPSFTLTNVQVNDGTVTGRLQWSDDETEAAGVQRYVQPFTVVVNDDGLISRADLTYDENDAQTVEYLDYLDAQEEGDDEDPTGEFTEVALSPQPAGNQPGSAFIFPEEGGVSGVFVAITPGAAGVQQPAHFHTGTCAAPGPIVEPLANVLDGDSFTLLSASYDELTTQGLIINVHLSVAQASQYVSCGVVGAAAAAPTETVVPGTSVPAATSTPATGIGAPDTGTGSGGDGTMWWLYVAITAGAFACVTGARALLKRG